MHPVPSLESSYPALKVSKHALTSTSMCFPSLVRRPHANPILSHVDGLHRLERLLYLVVSVTDDDGERYFVAAYSVSKA